ncbi:MAG TPA: type II secretion system F family protein [Gemmatimonadaceae bacterium]|jgi:tight adherence protein B|nr:type II secretion system F family protein [Gemmatimonadaceae bacterium]
MYLILGLVFASVLGLLVATDRFIRRRQLVDARALRDRLTPTVTPDAGAVRILKDDRASQLEPLNQLLSGLRVTTRVAKALEQAGSPQTVGAFLMTCAIGGGIGFLIGRGFGMPVASVLTAAGLLAPVFILKRKQHRRIATFQAQLPDAIDMLVNAMKAGYSLQAAMKFVGDEVPPPLGPEFARFYDEQRLGMDVRAALSALQSRVDTLDLRMFVTAMLIQRETGGNLAEIMSNLSTLMRQRAATRGQIDTLTAEPRMSAVVLTLLPIGLFVLFNVLNREYMSTLYTTPVGRFLMAYGAVSTVIGYLILRAMGNIDV